MYFEQFKKKLQKHVAGMLKDQAALFVTDTVYEIIWNLYLDSFPPGTNEVFRKRREYDCSCCRHFIRYFGNVVAIKDNKVVTIWDLDVEHPFDSVARAMATYVRGCPVRDVFITKEAGFGTDKSHERLEDKSVKTWEHFRVNLPKQFISTSSKSVPSLMAEARDIRNVFKRSLDEISKDAVETVLDLIAQKSLYRGEEWQGGLDRFQEMQEEYLPLSDDQKENYCWAKSVAVGGAVGKIRNHSIGVLLTDITAGMDLDDAVKRYEKIVAPSNYQRPKPIFSKKMVEVAQQALVELGLVDSLGRRHATIEDITVNNILFANKDAALVMSGDVFSELKQEASINPRSFSKIEEVSIDDFVGRILAKSYVNTIDILLENRHESNLVSLIAPEVPGSKSLFKWDNGFSLAYNGNMADSMREHVKAAGGNVDGVLRFSIQWNDSGDNQNDFDAHCFEPNGNQIYFGNAGRQHMSTGVLDVDIRRPWIKVAVENITWTVKRCMQTGVYKFLVHNYAHNGGRKGFSAEIEFDGQIYSFNYDRELKQDERVDVAEVTLDKSGAFSIKELLPSSTSSRTIWSLNTNQFHPVTVMMHSPNHWDGNGVGHKHYMFMLKDCLNSTRPNGFFNEFLRADLIPHRRVFEALGSKMRVPSSENQLSGLGFSSTKRNSVICKVGGSFTRTIKLTI